MMQESTLFNEIKTLIHAHDVVLFMKGTCLLPQCGFSGFVAQVLERFHIPVKDVNILERSDLRQGIKDFSDWPTIPQLYIKGEFIGGADIVRDMFKSGDLEKLLVEKGLLSRS